MYSGETQPVGTMAIDSLQKDRTLYRHLLEKELENGNALLHGQRENGENKVQLRHIHKYIQRLDALQQSLEYTGEKLSIMIEGHEQEGEILDQIQDDWDYISTVMDCRDELVNLQISLQEQGSTKGNSSSICRLDRIKQLRLPVQQVLIGQHRMQHQQANKANSNKRDVAGFLEKSYANAEADATTTMIKFTCTRLGGEQCSGGVTSREKEIITCDGPLSETDQNLGGRQAFGGDQSLGGGPRLACDQNLGKIQTLKKNLTLGEVPELGTNQSPGGGQRLGKVNFEKRRAGKGYKFCKKSNPWLKLKPRMIPKSKRAYKPRKFERGLQRRRHKAKKKNNVIVKKILTAKWGKIRDMQKGVQLGRGQQFKRDLGIRVLSLGRGPILGKHPGKSRLQICIRFTNCTTLQIIKAITIKG